MSVFFFSKASILPSIYLSYSDFDSDSDSDFFILTWKDFEVFLMVWSTKINTLETTNAVKIKSYPFHSLIIVTDHERLRSLINWFEKRYGRFRKPAMIAHTAKDRWGAHHICR